MDPLQRAEEFSRSQRFLNLVKEAKDAGVTVELEGKTTIIRRDTSESASITEWIWDTHDAEDFIFMVLQKKVEIYRPK